MSLPPARAALPYTSDLRIEAGDRLLPRYVEPRPSHAGPREVVAERSRRRLAGVMALAGIVALVAAGVAGGIWLRSGESADGPAAPASAPGDPAPYDRKARELARMFRDNFEQFAADAGGAVAAAGPRV